MLLNKKKKIQITTHNDTIKMYLKIYKNDFQTNCDDF